MVLGNGRRDYLVNYGHQGGGRGRVFRLIGYIECHLMIAQVATAKEPVGFIATRIKAEDKTFGYSTVVRTAVVQLGCEKGNLTIFIQCQGDRGPYNRRGFVVLLGISCDLSPIIVYQCLPVNSTYLVV